MVNRDLTRRIKAASGVTWSRKAIHGDLSRALELIRCALLTLSFSLGVSYFLLGCRFFDEKSNLWEYSKPAESADETEAVSHVTPTPECNWLIFSFAD